MKYNVYSIDYGCYVELANTTRFPLGLFEEELENGESEYCQVPKDDYRSIRRAILNMDEFMEMQKTSEGIMKHDLEYRGLLIP